MNGRRWSVLSSKGQLSTARLLPRASICVWSAVWVGSSAESAMANLEPNRSGSANNVSMTSSWHTYSSSHNFVRPPSPAPILTGQAKLAEEGNTPHATFLQFVHTFYDRPHSSNRQRSTVADSMSRRRASPVCRRLRPSRRPHSRRRRGRCLESDPRNRLHLLCPSLRFRADCRVSRPCSDRSLSSERRRSRIHRHGSRKRSHPYDPRRAWYRPPV